MKCSVVSLPARRRNLDRYLIDEQRECFAVFDGTTAGGEFSELFVNWLVEMVKAHVSQLEDPPYYFIAERAASLERMMKQANTELPERMSERYGGRLQSTAVGAGSTLALAYYGGSDWVIVNSGDSEVLLVRNGKLFTLSHRDSEFNQWLEDGLIEEVNGELKFEKEGDVFKFKKISVPEHEIFRSMKRMVRWIGNGAVPHVNIVPTKPGDILILWTDGAEHIVDWHIRDENWKRDEEKIINAAIDVSKGKAQHLLAALPSFWETYKPGERLWDDATALVVYED